MITFEDRPRYRAKANYIQANCPVNPFFGSDFVVARFSSVSKNQMVAEARGIGTGLPVSADATLRYLQTPIEIGTGQK